MRLSPKRRSVRNNVYRAFNKHSAASNMEINADLLAVSPSMERAYPAR